MLFSEVKMISMSNLPVLALPGNGGRFSGGFDINVIQEVQQTGNGNLSFDTNIFLKCCFPMFAHIQYSVTVYQAGNLSRLGRVSVDLMINTIEGRCLFCMLLPFVFISVASCK